MTLKGRLPLRWVRGVRLAFITLTALLVRVVSIVLTRLLACSGGPIPNAALQSLILWAFRHRRRGAILVAMPILCVPVYWTILMFLVAETRYMRSCLFDSRVSLMLWVTTVDLVRVG